MSPLLNHISHHLTLCNLRRRSLGIDECRRLKFILQGEIQFIVVMSNAILLDCPLANVSTRQKCVTSGKFQLSLRCDTPLVAGPRLINFFKPIFMASNSSSGFRRGITHFFTATKNTTEGVEGRTNEQYGLGSAPSARKGFL